MRFLTRKGLIFFTCLFASLFIVHVISTFSYQATVRDYVAAGPETSIEEDAGKDSAAAEGSTLAHKIITRQTTTTILQILLVLTGLPLLYFLNMNVLRSHKRLNNIMRELEESNKTFIFNSLEKVNDQNEEEVKARLIKNLKKVREFIKAITGGDYAITWEGMNK